MIAKIPVIKDQNLDYYRCKVAKLKLIKSQRGSERLLSYFNFHGKASNNLSVPDILHLLCVWVNTTNSTVEKMKLSENSRQTVIDRTSLCHEFCTLARE